MIKKFSRREALKTLGAGGVLASIGVLGGCGGSTTRAEPEEAIADSLLSFTPENQAATFRHVNRLGYTRVIQRGTAVLPLPAHSRNLGAMRYTFAGQSYSIEDYMKRNRTSGLLILKNGAIALERYGMGNDAETRWTSFSAAKSLTSTLIGAALKDGSIANLDDKVSKYVAQLKDSAYAANSIRELLRMSSGVRWIENYSSSADSDIARLLQAVQSKVPGAAMAAIGSRPRAAAPGTVFNYSTGESYVLGAVVAAATGTSLSEYASKKIWAPMGMEKNAYWLLDAENGLEMGGNNFSACLRDYGRFGLFFLRQGMIQNRSILPDGWRDLAGHPDTPLTACGNLYPDYALGYGYQWWSFPTGASSLAVHDGAFSAMGIFGQFIYINPALNIVAVVWSAWPESWIDSAESETFTLIGNAVALLA
ncbi:serine hydrolase domain-containing protein [Undibacterium curvum]|uniref:Serine hydrolase n=1 Tax=Undibacterium curvum TaxID=2762294 RepID=A0ABR7A1E2_9BURK|nr:serine hydrolase [Undibacterium curvum]MBC3930652.1 serine hydrolase [Undibacterium curvum]